MAVQLTLAHWLYLFFVIAVVVTMFLRKDTPLICLIGALCVGWAVTGSFLGAVQSVFNAIVVTAIELMGIVAVISLMVALSKQMEKSGAAAVLIRTLGKPIKGPASAFWFVGIITAILALFIWPTPAVALIGSLLVPVAVSAGLSPVGAGVAIAMFAYGISLTTDFVIQGAPTLTAKAAGLPVGTVMSSMVPLIITWAVIAIPLTYYFTMKANKGYDPKKDIEIFGESVVHSKDIKHSSFAKAEATIVSLAFLVDIILMLALKLRGGDATALLGGTAALLLLIFTLLQYKSEGLEVGVDFLREGFMFGVKIFAPVFVIAALFYMGGGPATQIFGSAGKPLLFDLSNALAAKVPLNRFAVAPMQAIIGAITGLDGSGFSGLPLMGTLAGGLGTAASVKTSVMAALGQLTAVNTGGGTIVPWALIAVAAVCKTKPEEIARKNFVPVILGFVGATIVAMILM
ncbi:MAG: hypothetical protein WHT65_06130 [Pseudothermotoga sp.]